MMRLFFTIILLILVLSPLFTAAQNPPQYYWYYYVIDRDKPIGASTTLLYDKKGLPNIAYCRPEERTGVKLARYDGTAWKVQEVDRRGSGRVVMALDGADVPHIIYHTDGGGKVKHALYNGQQWSVTTIDSTLNAGSYYGNAIQVDAKGRVHICYVTRYRDTGFDQMTYAFLDSGRLSPGQRIDNAGINGKWCSLTLDAQQRPCLAYYSFVGDLAFGYLENGRWKLEHVDNDGSLDNQGFYPSIQRDMQNNFLISFQSHTPGRVRLARGRPHAWSIEDITAANWMTFSTPNPLALDKQGNPYVAFYDLPNGDLKLAYKLGDQWTIITVDSVGKVGESAALAFNPDGLPAISYYDSTRGYLRFAVASLTPPPDTDQDGVPDYLELAYGTRSNDVDSDDDGLSDGEEDINRNGLAESYETDPKNPDTDKDGILDGVERGRVSGVVPPPGIQGTDAAIFRGDADPSTKTNPLLADTDGDGLKDGSEDKNTNGRVEVDEPDPNNRDTDADGLSDGLEVQRGMSPLDLDSDDDGLADNQEDKNLNGKVDNNETDPAQTDTDDDSLPDGLEIGATQPVADPDGPGKLLATDPSKFRRDADPSTTTDPNHVDTDADHLKDGNEDKNRNGRFDAAETDPLNADTDGDKLPDGGEIFAGTNPLDRDTDDDGLADGVENANYNSTVDLGETSPQIFDSDDDGVSDGLESGLASGMPDPDGNGPLLGTDLRVFLPDADPKTNSQPLLWDTDNDGLSDGEEDANHNGAVDSGETHFLATDTDTDGLSDGDEISFKSDPYNPGSKAPVILLFKDKFLDSGLQGWTVFDEGKIEAPSDWLAYNGALIQTSNIWGGETSANEDDPHKPGTYIALNNLIGTNCKITFTLRSGDDDELGLMFHYQDRQNYYRFSMNAGQRYRRLTKLVNGQASVIATQEFSYRRDQDYEIKVFVAEGRIQVYLENRRVFDIKDRDLKAGSIAFYCWKNAGAGFRDLSVTGQGQPVTVDGQAPANTDQVSLNFALSPAYPNPTSGPSIFMLQTPRPAFIKYEIFDLLGRSVRVIEKIHEKSGALPLVWDGHDERDHLAPTGIYFMCLRIADVRDQTRVLWQTIKKIQLVR